jgi:hypothetical protein
MYWNGSLFAYSANSMAAAGCSGYCDNFYVVQRCSATGALRYRAGPFCIEC